MNRDRLLRLMASVPLQPVMVEAPDFVVDDLNALGFRPTTLADADPEDLYGWGVVMLENQSWLRTLDVAIAISRRIVEGGWIFVATSTASGGGEQYEAARRLDDAIENEQLVVAQELLVERREQLCYLQAVIRRVGHWTPI